MKEFVDLLRYTALLQGEAREKFECFQNLLTEYNRKYNLTAITAPKEIFYKHFLDSVAGESLFPEKAAVAEIGSGAGFPSIPLKILRDDLSFTLIESTGKKCDFLQVVIEKLQLCNVKVLNHRAEDAAKDGTLRERFDVCTARAVARLNTLAEYCMPFVRKGGLFIAYKGSDEEEIEEAKRALFTLGGESAKKFVYELPEGYGKRTLVVTYKKEHTPLKYPRGNGKERSKPIV